MKLIGDRIANKIALIYPDKDIINFSFTGPIEIGNKNIWIWIKINFIFAREKL